MIFFFNKKIIPNFKVWFHVSPTAPAKLKLVVTDSPPSATLSLAVAVARAAGATGAMSRGIVVPAMTLVRPGCPVGGVPNLTGGAKGFLENNHRFLLVFFFIFQKWKI